MERKLAPRGAKADLARYLSERYGRPARSWESNLAQIIGRTVLPNAELLLAIDAWLAQKKTVRVKKTRTAKKGALAVQAALTRAPS